MKRWPTKSLSDLAEVKAGFAWKAAAFSGNPAAGPPVIRIQNLGENDNAVFAYYTGEIEPGYWVDDGDLLVSLSGSFKVCRWQGPKALLNQRIVLIRPRQYLNRQFAFFQIAERLKEISSAAVGIAVANASMGTVRDMKMSLPPLAEQERIVKLLDEADELRKLRAQAGHRTAALIPALFHEMFGDPISNPTGWPLAKLSEIAPLKSGYAFKSTDYCAEGVRLVRISNLDGQNLVFDEGTVYLPESFLHECPPFQLAAGDVLIAMSGATTGKLGMVRSDDVPSLLNQRVGKFFIRDASRIQPTFLFSTLGIPAVTRKLIGEAAGSAQANVSPSGVGSVEIPVPPLPLQKEFAQRVAEIRALEAAQAASRQRLEALFQSMLHRAFNGEF